MNSIFQKMCAWLAKLIKPAFRKGKSQEDHVFEANAQPTFQDSKSPCGPKPIPQIEPVVSARTSEETQMPVETRSDAIATSTVEARSADPGARQPDEKHSMTEALGTGDLLANSQNLQTETFEPVINGVGISNVYKEVKFPHSEQQQGMDESHAVPEQPIENSEDSPKITGFKADHLEDPLNAPIKIDAVSETAICEGFVAGRTAFGEVRDQEGDSPAVISKVVAPIQNPREAPLIPEQKKDLAQETSGLAVADEWEGFSERRLGGTPVAVEPPTPRPGDVFKKATKEDDTSTETGGQLATERQKKPPPPVDISPYDEPGAKPLPESYCYWNRILTARFIRAVAQAQVHLATSPRLLAATLSEDLGKRVPPSEAEVQFVEAVRTAYHTLAMDSPARIKKFRHFSPTDGMPMCVAFLALSVLAAHRMHGDEISSGSAYYVRLAELLNVPLGSNTLPTDFRTDDFESLWGFLAEWVSKKMQLTLVLPESSAQKRYIAYPLAHVPLRQLDLEKLPAFFDWAGYSSDTQISSERMTDDFRRWDQSYASLSDAGRTAINDSRLSAVLAQVRSELRAWDGLTADSQGQRRAQVEILLETVMRRSKLSLLAPRKDGYPKVFSSGSVELSGGESWYDPLELGPDDGELLLTGFSWQSEEDRKCVLSRPAGKVFALAPYSDYSGLVSRSEIPKDTLCAILCHESLVESVRSYLTGICDTVTSPIQNVGLPTGWRLFQKVRAVRLPENLPAELRSLNVASRADIIPQGGLRIASHWTWMQGSPPRLLIYGHEGQSVYINENVKALDDEGYVKTDQIFEVAGIYQVRVGSLVKNVRIIEPSLRPSLAGSGYTGAKVSKPQYEVILAPGEWILIGRTPFNSSCVAIDGRHTRLAFCSFEPTFAIKVGGGPGAKVIQFAWQSVECCGKIKKIPDTQRWANAIYSASIRHPVLECVIENDQGHTAQDWAEYVRFAKRLKRQWRQRHQ